MTAPAPTELLKLADRIEYALRTEGRFTIYKETAPIIIDALRQAASVERAEVAGEAITAAIRTLIFKGKIAHIKQSDVATIAATLVSPLPRTEAQASQSADPESPSTQC